MRSFFYTTPVDIINHKGEWIETYRYEPFIDKWFVVRPNDAATIGLLRTNEVPVEIINSVSIIDDEWSRFAYYAPVKCQIQINRNCNYSCKICYASSYKGKARQDDLTFDELSILLVKLKKIGVLRVNFVGGEPFLHKEFIKIIILCQKLRLLVSCITNARIPGQKINEYKNIIKSMFNIQVSCNGIGDSYVNEYNADSWDKAKKAITNVIKESRTNILSYVIKEDNIEDIPVFLEFANSINPTKVKFGSVCWSGRSKNDGAVQYYRNIIPRARKLIDEGRKKYFNMEILSQLDMGKESPAWEQFENDYRPFEFYYAPEARDGFYVQSDGSIYPFPLLSDHPELRVGNVKDDDIFDLWKNSKIFNEIRDVTFQNSACGILDCDKICGLWSRSYAIAWTGNLYGKIPCIIDGFSTN